VLDFLVARYGEFVLLKPRVEPHTLLLWLLPPLALAGGGVALWINGRRRSKSAAADDGSTVKLTADERSATAKADRRRNRYRTVRSSVAKARFFQPPTRPCSPCDKTAALVFGLYYKSLNPAASAL